MSKKLIYLVSFVFVPSLVLTSVAKGVDPSLVGWWKFDEASGTLYDQSDNHNDGTSFQGVLYQQTGQVGYALGFDGIDDYVVVGTTGRPTDTFSFGGWLKTSATHQIDPESTSGVGGVAGQRYAFDPQHGGDSNGGAGLSVGTNGILVYEHGSNYMPATAVYQAEIGNDWNHIMVVYNNKWPTIYLNGHAVRTGFTSPRAVVNAPIRFGGIAYGFFEGLIDEVRIYNRALSAAEIKLVMQGEGEGEGFPYAFSPVPPDGALYGDTWVDLIWSPGIGALSHDVYFGDNFDDVNDGNEGTFQGNQTGTYFTVGLPGHPYPDGLVPGVTYYWRIDEKESDGTVYKGDVWSFMTPLKTAYDPYPVDDIDFIDPNVILSWEPGFGARLHYVYFGDDFANVNDADTSDTTGIYRGVQASTTYTPGPLALDSPYYWRVDGLVGSARSRETHKGAVWSFTTARSGTGTIGREVFVRVIGPEEVVFDWSTDHCERDIPDVPARAFRDADGKVQLIASHSVNRRMIGNTLDSVERDCHIIMDSDKDPDPSKFNHGEFLISLYTLDGETIYALVHNEYHGDLYPGQCPSGDHRKCGYTAITFAKSTDKGRTYSHPTPPDHLVASVPYPYKPVTGHRAMGGPSNIVYNPNSGYYYTLVKRSGFLSYKGGVLVMRTRTLDDPKSWRAWDGKDFTVRFINPYTEPDADPANHVGQPVSPNFGQSLTFNTYLNKFLLVGMKKVRSSAGKERVRGFYYSLSNDLIYWTPLELITEVKAGWPLDDQEDAINYASLIDPNDTSRNFERTGQRPYLYYTHWHRDSGRDLVRVPIEFSYSPPPPSPDPLSEALDTDLRFTTGGSADWFSQTSTFYNDGDAARSGDISGDQESWMQTTVSGKGTVNFYWKVSSERRFDFLEFYIDGSLQERISGSVNWEQKTYTITDSGLHTLEWQYIKDGSVDSGSDCGWVDKVEWVTTP